MNWFGLGKKKKPEEKYKLKLNQLQKLGYGDRKKNTQLLKLYAGDVNLVMQDYSVQPSSQSISPKQPKQSPKQQPKQSPKQQPKQSPKQSPKQQSKPIQRSPPKSQQKQSPKQVAQQPPKPISKPETKESPKPQQLQESAFKRETKSPPKYPKATMPKATLKPDTATSSSPPQSLSPLKYNLRSLISSDIRQILINIGEPMIGEIILSNSINGDAFYNYTTVHPLLNKFNISFGDEASYHTLVKQIELSFERNGAVNVHNKEEIEEKKPIKQEEKKGKDTVDYDGLKENIPNLISSDVRLLLLPFNVELAERLYAFSVSGADLYAFDYDGVVFASGIKGLSKADWNTIVTELALPQTEAFDANKWQKLQKDQEALIERAKDIDKQMKAIQQDVFKKAKQEIKPKPKPQQKPPFTEYKSDVKASDKVIKRQKKQLERIIQMDKQTDKFMPLNLQKLKQRQLSALTTLHDIASIIDVDSSIVDDIYKSARRESLRELSIYLKSKEKKTEVISVEAIEKRQLQLLSTIHQTRSKLQKLAQSKGISLDALNNITSTAERVDAVSLNKSFDELFVHLADIAVSVQATAKQYGVSLEDTSEMNKFIVPMYNDLFKKQNTLIARIEYLNDQARMINPKAVEVNEEILHISRHAHRRTSSGPPHLAVPRSPGDSPTPQDHFPDTLETKEAYDNVAEHPSSLPLRKHSRSPSLSPGILITAPDETEREANQVRKRRKSLQVNANALSSTLKEFDRDNDGYLNEKTFVAALNKMRINVSLNDDNIKIILNDVRDEKGINIDKLINFVCEVHSTLKLDSCKQWNSFRMKIISVKR